MIGGTHADASHAFGNNNTLIGGGSGGTVIAVGNNNKSNNSAGSIFGSANELLSGFSKGGIILGTGNKTSANIVVGMSNIESSNTHSYSSVILGKDCRMGDLSYNFYCGEGLETPTDNSSVRLFGRYNSLTYSLNNPTIIFGCGNSSSNRGNALECNKATVKIAQNLQLKTDTTEVNAITPPQDPNNVTADDMTLATVSHLGSSYRKSQVAYFSDYDSATSIPTDGTSVDFTTFGTKPAWANRALVTFRWENELFEKEIHFTRNEGIHLYAVQQAYSTFPDTIVYKQLRLEWDYTNQTLTAAGFWTYDQDMANAGAISGWDRTLTNTSTCKILSVVYSE